MANRKTTKQAINELEDRLDDTLFDCLEIMKMGSSKLRLTTKGDIIPLYPHPIISEDGFTVLGVQYLTNKNVFLPDALFDRLVYWEDLIDADAPIVKKKVRPTIEDVKMWAKLKESGMSISDIKELTGAESSVSYYIKKYVHDIKEEKNELQTA